MADDMSDSYQPLTKEQVLGLLLEAKNNKAIMIARMGHHRELTANFDLGEESHPGDFEWWKAHAQVHKIGVRLERGVVPGEQESQEDAAYQINKVFFHAIDGPLISFTDTELEAFAQQLFEIMHHSSRREDDKDLGEL